MIKAQLDLLITELDLRTLPSSAIALRLYWLQDSKWNDETGHLVDDASLIATLRATTQSTSPTRAGQAVFYPVPKLDAVIEIDFLQRVRAATVARAIDAVANLIEIADLRFKAERTILTGLINKAKFVEVFTESLLDYEPQGDEATAASATPQQKYSISVIALDLDVFKQVNDNYGHDYGDVVLKALGLRLAAKQQMLTQQYPRILFELSHLSGEEFAMLVVGNISLSQLRQIADAVRESVEALALPTSDELNTVSPDYASADMPPEADRWLTISVGVASRPMPIEKADVKSVVNELMKHADEAMYRAKTAGRNTVCFYSEILTQLGRVLEWDSTTQLVAIDIGSNVGVRPGQEFYVYDSRFFGKTPFVYSDGRTERWLGVYPQHTHARIVARYVQKEISFCDVSEPSTSVIKPESRLHAVPLGALTKLGPTLVYGGPLRLSNPEEVSDVLKESGHEEKYTVAFSLADSERILRSRGEVTVNRAVEHLYDAIVATVPPDIRIIQVPPVEFVLVGVSDVSAAVAGVLTKYRQTDSREYRLKIGTFNQKTYAAAQDKHPWDHSDFKPESAVNLARYAASETKKLDEATPFSVYTASSVMHSSRMRGDYDSAISDFDLLTSFGLDSAQAYNQVALCIIEGDIQSKLDLALSYMNEAIELSPEPVYFANRGLVYWHLGNDEARNVEVLEAFKRGLAAEALPLYTRLALGALCAADNPRELLPDEMIEAITDQARLQFPGDEEIAVQCDLVALAKRIANGEAV